MATVAQLTIEMAANISSLRTDMESAKSTVSGAMDSISGHVATAAKSFMGISETMNGTSAALTSLAASAQGLNGLSDQVAGLSKGIDALNAHVEKQTTGWRANVVAISAVTSTVRSGIEIMEKFGGSAPIWTRDFSAFKDKLNETGTSLKVWTQGLATHNEEAIKTGPALQSVEQATTTAAGGFRAAIPAVGGFVAALAPLLIIGALVAAAVVAVKVAIAGATDVVNGSIPGFSGVVDTLKPFAEELKTAAIAAQLFGDKFGYTAAQATVFIESGKAMGVSSEGAAKAMQALTDAVADAPEKFKKFNVDIKDGNGHMLGMSEVAKNVKTSLDEFATEADRTAVLLELLGGKTKKTQIAVTELDAALSINEDWKTRQALIEKFNLVIGQDAVDASNKYRDALKEFNTQSEYTWRSMKLTIGSAVMPMLTELFEKFTGGWPKVADAFRDGVIFMTRQAYSLREVLFEFADGVVARWGKLQLAFGALKTLQGDASLDNIKAAYEKFQTDAAALDAKAKADGLARQAEYQKRIAAMITSGKDAGDADTIGVSRHIPEAISEAAVQATKDLTALQDALEKANLAWQQAAQQAAFQINTDEAKIKIKELELLFKQVGSPEALMKLYDAQTRELELFSQNAQTKIRQAFDYINKLQTELNATTDAERRLRILALIAAEEQKADSIAVELNSEKGKSLAIYDGILEKQRASNKVVFDGVIAVQYATADYITALQNVEDHRAFEITLIGKTQLQQDILRSAYQAELDIRKMTLEIARLQQRLLTEMNEDQQILLKRQIAGVQSQVEARKATEDSVPAALALKKATTDVADAWKSVSDTSVNFFNDLFNNGSKAFGNLWTVIKKFFFDLAAQFATKFVIEI